MISLIDFIDFVFAFFNCVKLWLIFDKDKFSDPTTLIKNLHEKNIHLGLQFNPIDGINPHEEHYLDIANKYGIVDNKIIAFDANNPELLNSIYELLLKPLKKPSSTVVICDVLNDHSGKLVNNQFWLKAKKKAFYDVVIFDVSNDHSGKLVIAQP